MKIQVFCSLLLVAFALVVGANVSGDALPKSLLEEHVLNFLTKWRSGILVTSLFTLPSLKSISIPGIQAKYNENGITLNLNIGDMKLTGLDKTVVESIDVKESQDLLDVSIGLKASKLTLSAENYQLSGRAILIPLRGNGAMTLDILDVSLSLNARISNVNNSYTAIEDISLSYTIGAVKANLEKATWPINDVLSKDGPGILQGFQNDLAQAVKDQVIPLANGYLSTVTFEEFLKYVADVAGNAN